MHKAPNPHCRRCGGTGWRRNLATMSPSDDFECECTQKSYAADDPGDNALIADQVPSGDAEWPTPVERELWEALDRLLTRLDGFHIIHQKAEWVAATHTRDRLRPLMQEGQQP